jgi:hypothetical protein
MPHKWGNYTTIPPPRGEGEVENLAWNDLTILCEKNFPPFRG